MTQAESVKLLCELFRTGKGAVAGDNFSLEVGPDCIYLVGSNMNEVNALLSHLGLVVDGLGYASNANPPNVATMHAVVIPSDQVAQLVTLLGPLSTGTYPAEITKVAAKINYDEFKTISQNVNRNLQAAANQLVDPKYNALKQKAAQLLTSTELHFTTLNALAKKLKTNTASAAEKQQFDELLLKNSQLIQAVTALRLELRTAEANEADPGQKQCLQQMHAGFQMPLKMLKDFNDPSTPVGKVVKAIHLKKMYEDLNSLVLADEQKKLTFDSVRLFNLALNPKNDPAKMNPLLSRIIKESKSNNFSFCAKVPDSSEYYIQCSNNFPNEIKQGQLMLILQALEKDMGRPIGRLDATNGRIVFTPVEAEAVRAQYKRLALPGPAAGTRVAPVVPGAGGPPAPGHANPKFDLFKAANQTALKTAVETKLNLKWDATNPASIRIYKDGEDAKKSIYLQKATNSLETTSTEPEVYGRMANLMKELMPSAPGAEGITAVEITNGANDVVELAKIAKEMLDKGLGVKVDLTQKGAIRAVDEAAFTAALKRVGGPGGDALVHKYQDKKNELEPRIPGPMPR